MLAQSFRLGRWSDLSQPHQHLTTKRPLPVSGHVVDALELSFSCRETISHGAISRGNLSEPLSARAQSEPPQAASRGRGRLLVTSVTITYPQKGRIGPSWSALPSATTASPRSSVKAAWASYIRPRTPSADTRRNLRMVWTPQTILVDSSGLVIQDWRGAYTGQTANEIEAHFGLSLPGLDPDQLGLENP